MDAKTLAAAADIDPALAAKWAEPLTRAMARFYIATPQRQAHFIAQIGHESASFARLTENLNYSAEALLKTWPKRFTKETAAAAARKPEVIAASLKAQLLADLADLDVLSKEDLLNRRYQRLMNYGYA